MPLSGSAERLPITGSGLLQLAQVLMDCAQRDGGIGKVRLQRKSLA